MRREHRPRLLVTDEPPHSTSGTLTSRAERYWSGYSSRTTSRRPVPIPHPFHFPPACPYYWGSKSATRTWRIVGPGHVNCRIPNRECPRTKRKTTRHAAAGASRQTLTAAGVCTRVVKWLVRAGVDPLALAANAAWCRDPASDWASWYGRCLIGLPRNERRWNPDD